ncbi:MAG: sugar transferase [Verrucomicrobia bacterium]|nr:sugar transferase [Verrucomicrobiota bacterium]
MLKKVPVRHDPIKRLFDIVFSLTFLACFSPLYLILIALVKCSSQGPVFYKSTRLGRGGRTIDCIKFRTMYKDADARLKDLLASNPDMAAEWSAYQKLKNDPRITPIGKIMRKTSLDELPQFINVLKGDLSVVGPRPPTLMGPPEGYLQEISQLYGDSTAKILSVRPGITGVWQVSGRSAISFEERKKIEATYAENRTFWQDLRVIFKTIPAVFFSKGAF